MFQQQWKLQPNVIELMLMCLCFQLIANSSQLTQGQQPTIEIAKFEGYMVINSVRTNDLGEYQCDVTNNKGSARKTVLLSQKCKTYFLYF